MDEFSLVFGDKHTVPAFIGSDTQKEICKQLLELKADKLLIVTEETVDELYGDYFDSLRAEETGAFASAGSVTLEKFVLPSGEAAKSWENLTRLLEWNFKVDATKKSVVVAFGGGSLLNVAGLFASLAFRGMKAVYIPTTFLAMHYVATSLKTSISFDGRKDNIGSFFAPEKVLIDVGFCSTLPRNELFSGLGELAKNAALFGADHAKAFQRTLSKESIDAMNGGSGEEFNLGDDTVLALVKLGIDAKMSVLADDAYEKTSGMVFQYGHTVAHALEKAYDDGTIPHGIGVCYGMLSCSFAAEKMGLMSGDDRREHDAICGLLVERCPLPEPKPSLERVMDLVMRDSQRGLASERDAEVSDVLIRRVGDIVTTPSGNLSRFSAAYVAQWLEEMGFKAASKSKMIWAEAVDDALCDDAAISELQQRTTLTPGLAKLSQMWSTILSGQKGCETRLKLKNTFLSFDVVEPCSAPRIRSMSLDIMASSVIKRCPAACTGEPDVGSDGDTASTVSNLGGDGWKTTLVFRNIPTMTRELLLQTLDAEGFAVCYDFVYLPMVFESGTSFGHCFVNFTQPATAEAALRHFRDFRAWKGCGNTEPCAAKWSDQQGLDVHLENYRNSRVMHSSFPDNFKPLLLSRGVAVQFPAPTKHIPAPRLRKERRRRAGFLPIEQI